MKFNTYSIIAVCRETGCMGGAAASCFPGLGAFSPFIRISHGIIASQGWVNPFLNEDVMGRIQRGASAEEALRRTDGRGSGRRQRPSVRLPAGDTAALVRVFATWIRKPP